MVMLKSGSDAGGTLVSVYFEDDSVPDETEWSTDVRGKRSDKVIEIATDAVGESVELARTCAARFVSGLANLADGVRPPDEVQLQLSIALKSDVGAMLAKAGAAAEFQVAMTWRLPDGAQGSDGAE
jgi:hypothetical protein